MNPKLTLDRNAVLAVLAALTMALACMHSVELQPLAGPGDVLGPGTGLLLAWFLGHCDGMDGPVVTLARKALASANVNLVLPWVQERYEGKIREAFEHTLQVRKANPAARELADMCFFETLVRIHRAGEGAAYTGLKPAGRDLGPAIPAADRALEDGSIDRVIELVSHAVRRGIRDHFERVMRKKKFDSNDVRSAREYVEAYVPYIHYVERLYQAAAAPVHGHHDDEEEHHGPQAGHD